MKLKVKIVPASSKTEFVGWMNDTYKIKIKEPPEKGKANQGLIKALAKHFNIKSEAITLLSGHNLGHQSFRT